VRLDLDQHLGRRVLDGLEGADHHAELFPLLCVLHCGVEHAFHHPERIGCDENGGTQRDIIEDRCRVADGDHRAHDTVELDVGDRAAAVGQGPTADPHTRLVDVDEVQRRAVLAGHRHDEPARPFRAEHRRHRSREPAVVLDDGGAPFGTAPAATARIVVTPSARRALAASGIAASAGSASMDPSHAEAGAPTRPSSSAARASSTNPPPSPPRSSAEPSPNQPSATRRSSNAA
jgi:hypothetical protein